MDKKILLWVKTFSAQITQIGLNTGFMNELTMIISSLSWMARNARMSERLANLLNEYQVINGYFVLLQEVCKNKVQLYQLDTSALVSILDCIGLLGQYSNIQTDGLVDDVIEA